MIGRRISLDPVRIVDAFGWTIILLSLAHLATQTMKLQLDAAGLHGLIRLFDMAQGANLPTTFAGLQAFVCALALGLVAAIQGAERDRHAPYWALLASFAFWLSLTELSEIHQLTLRPLRGWLLAPGEAAPTWTLVGVGMMAGIAVSIAFAGFALHALPRAVRERMCLGMLLLFLGAIGVAVPEARHAEAFGTDNLTYAIYVLIERFLEMTGVLIMLSGVLEYLRLRVAGVTLAFRSTPVDQAAGAASAGARDRALPGRIVGRNGSMR